MTAFIRFVGRFPYSEQPVSFYFIRVTGPSLLFWVMSFGSRHHDVFHFSSLVTCFPAYRTFRVGFYTDEVTHCLVSSVFYLFSKKIKGGQNELVKSPKMIAMTALIRVISF